MIYIYGVISLLTFIMLIFDKTIQVTLLNSFLFDDEYVNKNRFLIYVIYSFLSPITFTQILIIKIKNKQIPSFMKYIKYLLIAILVGVAINGLVKAEIKYYNQSVLLETSFNKKINERLTILDQITKIVHQKLELAKMNDTSFTKVMTLLTSSRKDGESVYIKLTMESNPMATYEEVSSLYRDVSASIDSKRNNLLEVEKELQSITADYAALHKQFPSSIYLYYEAKTLNYIPISTSANKVINSTGVDNEIKL